MAFDFHKLASNGQLLLTLLTAAGALYVSIQQHELKQQVDAQNKTFRYAEVLEKYIDKMPPDDKETQRLNALRIDLADAVTSAASSRSGEIKQNRLKHMPMWLALSTGNSEGLRLIAGDDEGREIWFAMALASSDKKVRETAMEVVRTGNQLPPKMLHDVFRLSDEFDNPEIEDKALASIQQIVSRAKRRGDLSIEPDDVAIDPIVKRIVVVRTSLRGDITSPDIDLPTRELLQKRERALTATLASLGVQEQATSGAMAGATTPPPATPQTIEANQAALAALESPDANKRRDARATLASQLDPQTQKSLLGVITDSKANYRAQLGSVVALRSTTANVSLTDRDVASLVTLIGHSDATMRTNASELLMKITDPATVKAGRVALFKVVNERNSATASPNQVYNAVAILGTWARVLPDSLADERKEIDGFLPAVRNAMKEEPRWSKTAMLLDQLLTLQERQRRET